MLMCWCFLTSKSTSKVIPATACWTRTVKNCSTEASTLPAHTRTWHRHMHDSCTYYMHTNHLLVTQISFDFYIKMDSKVQAVSGIGSLRGLQLVHQGQTQHGSQKENQWILRRYLSSLDCQQVPLTSMH